MNDSGVTTRVITGIKSELLRVINRSIKESGLSESGLLELIGGDSKVIWHLKSSFSDKFTIDILLRISSQLGVLCDEVLYGMVGAVAKNIDAPKLTFDELLELAEQNKGKFQLTEEGVRKDLKEIEDRISINPNYGKGSVFK